VEVEQASESTIAGEPCEQAGEAMVEDVIQSQTTVINTIILMLQHMPLNAERRAMLEQDLETARGIVSAFSPEDAGKRKAGPSPVPESPPPRELRAAIRGTVSWGTCASCACAMTLAVAFSIVMLFFMRPVRYDDVVGNLVAGYIAAFLVRLALASLFKAERESSREGTLLGMVAASEVLIMGVTATYHGLTRELVDAFEIAELDPFLEAGTTITMSVAAATTAGLWLCDLRRVRARAEGVGHLPMYDLTSDVCSRLAPLGVSLAVLGFFSDGLRYLNAAGEEVPQALGPRKAFSEGPLVYSLGATSLRRACILNMLGLLIGASLLANIDVDHTARGSSWARGRPRVPA